MSTHPHGEQQRWRPPFGLPVTCQERWRDLAGVQAGDIGSLRMRIFMAGWWWNSHKSSRQGGLMCYSTTATAAIPVIRLPRSVSLKRGSSRRGVSSVCQEYPLLAAIAIPGFICA